MRRLGFKIPQSYVRIYCFTRFPKKFQKEICKYPETITEDSDYEEDEVVIEKYKGNQF